MFWLALRLFVLCVAYAAGIIATLVMLLYLVWLFLRG